MSSTDRWRQQNITVLRPGSFSGFITSQQQLKNPYKDSNLFTAALVIESSTNLENSLCSLS